MAADLTSFPWRTGRHRERNVYAQLDDRPSEDDPFVGLMETAELGRHICEIHNETLGGD